MYGYLKGYFLVVSLSEYFYWEDLPNSFYYDKSVYRQYGCIPYGDSLVPVFQDRDGQPEPGWWVDTWVIHESNFQKE